MISFLNNHFTKIVLPQHLFLMFGILTIIFGHSSLLWLILIPIGYIILGYIGGAIFVHRYWCHKSFETYTWIARVGAYLGLLSGIGTTIAMFVIHVHHHHKYADTENDPHSPKYKSKFKTWFMWKNYSNRYFIGAARKLPKRILLDPYLRFMHKYHYRIWWVSFILLLIINWQFAIFFVAGAGVYHYHIEGFVNSFCHDNTNGYRNGNTNDLSINHNSKLMMYLSFGSSLHNNHHLYPNKYSYIVKKGEFDLAHYLVPLIIKK